MSVDWPKRFVSGTGMNVVHIIDSGGLYGAEMMLLSLAEEQMKIGITPVIASIGDKGVGEKPLEIEARRRGLAVQPFRMVPGANPRGAMALIRFIHDIGGVLIHSHGYKGNILLGFIPFFIRKVPMVTTVHGYTSTHFFSRMKVYEALDRMTHRFMDRTIFVNQKMRDLSYFLKFPKSRWAVIDNGIPLAGQNPFIHPQGEKSMITSFCQEGLTIGTIGRLSEEKGYCDLIDALEIIFRRGVDVRLVIIGEGGEREAIEARVARKGLSGQVLMPGYMHDARDYLPFFDLYLVASITEGLPITLLEAMQANIPVVATAVGGIPDVIRHKSEGLLVAPRDAEQMADAVLWLVENPIEAAEMVRRASLRVASQYSAEKMAHEYWTLYAEIIRS